MHSEVQGGVSLISNLAVPPMLFGQMVQPAPGGPGNVVLNTLVLILGTLAISLPLGVFAAFLMARTNLPGRRLFLFLIAMILVVPLYLQTGAWQAGFGIQGWFTVATEIELIRGMAGAIWVHAVYAFGWVTVIVAVGLRLASRELEEEALLHVSSASVIRNVTLPAVAGAVGIAALWVAVVTAGEMTVTDLFRVRTYAEEIYVAHAATADMEAATLQVLPGILVTALLVGLGLVLCSRLMPRDEAISLSRLRDFDLGPLRWLACAAMTAIALVIIGIPLLNLVYRAGVQFSTDAGGAAIQSWNGVKFLDMVFIESVRQFGDEFRNSLIVATICASLVLFAATLLAWFGGAGRPQATGAYLIVALFLAIPGPLLGVFVIRLLGGFPAAYDSLAAPCLAISMRTLPFATIIMWHALRSLPTSMLDAARQEGAGPFARLTLIALPARWPAAVAAWLVVMVLAMGDLSASQLVQVPGLETLANRVFDRLHSGAYDQVCGMFLAVLGFFAIMTALVFWCLASWQRQMSVQRQEGRK